MKRAQKRESAQAILETLETRTLLSSYVVDTSLDESAANSTTSLREAILLANAGQGADTIAFDASLAGSTITLGGSALSITDDLTITGLGSTALTIDANNASRIFQLAVDNIVVAISGLTLTHGSSTLGGAILNNAAVLTLTDCTIIANTAGSGFGGGIANVANATLTVVNSAITGNTATFGGGISSDTSTLSIAGSLVSANTAPGGIGGGLYIDSGTGSVVGSTISANVAPYGAGLFVSTASLSVTNSTISINSGTDGVGLFSSSSTVAVTGSTFSSNAASGHGGAFFTGGGTFTARNSTVTGNTGGGIEVDTGVVTLVSTIVSGNMSAGSTPDDIQGLLATGSTNNLIGDTATAGGLANGVNANIVGVNPLLGSLSNNGGPTATHALLAGSPAINTGANPGAIATDQRGAGFPRARGSAVDIGAYEYSATPTIGSFAAAPGTILRGQAVTLTAVSIADADGSIARLDFYRDANNNGIADTGELIGSDSDASGGYTFAYAPDNAVPVGQVAVLAVALDNDGLASGASAAAFILQSVPLIANFAASPSNVLRGQTITLTAAGVADEDGSIARVDFYRDANQDGIADAGELIGSDAAGSDGYSLAFVPDTSVAQGVLTFMAIATDNDSHAGPARSANVALGAIPILGAFSVSPASVFRGQALALIAGDTSDADGTIVRVDFYRDINRNGIADAGELFGSDIDGANGYSAVFVPDGSTPVGSIEFLAAAVDNDGLTSVVRTAFATLRVVAPTVGSLAISTPSFGAGDPVALTADNVADADGTVTRVEFYADLNLNGIAEPAELLGSDTDGSNGYSLALMIGQTISLPEGTLTFLAVATDSDGLVSTSANASANNLFSVRTTAGRTLAATALDTSDRHFMGMTNSAGHPIVFEADAPWTAIDLSAATGAPLSISDLVFWVDPKDGLVYGTYAAESGLILLTRASDGTWSFRNLSNELGATSSPTARLVQFVSVDRVVVIVGFTNNGRIVGFQQTLALTASGEQAFRFVDLSGDLESQGMQTPSFARIASFVTEWNTWHLVGIDQNDHIQSVWIDPASFTQWRADDLSAQYASPPVQGQLAVTLTPWGGINLTAADASGHLQVTWWVPGNPWMNADLTASTGGVALSGGHITGYGTPWGGMNYIGLNTSGDVVGYWWAPDTDRWNTGPFLPASIPTAQLPSAELTSYSSVAGTLNILGTSSTGDALRLWWEPGTQVWSVDNLTLLAARA